MKLLNLVESLLPAAALFLCGQIAVAATSACEKQKAAAGQWDVKSETDIDVAALCDILKNVVNGSINFHGVIVERHGHVVAEAYRRGKDESIYSWFASTKNFDSDTLHDVRSITKSIVSLLWGIADGQGKTPPLSTPALDLLSKLANLKRDGRERITLQNLFTMNSGLDWNESAGSYGAFGNDETGLYWHSSQAKYLFDRAMIAPAGARFNYDGGGTAVIAQLLEQRVGMPLPEFARKYLFEPLGITEWEWKNDVRGRPLAFAGLRMKPRDLARIGQLTLDHGTWAGRQIVPAKWLDESTRRHLDAEFGFGYGYFWWTGQIDAPNATYDWSAGFGNGGQRLFVVPRLDVVVVITAGDYNKMEIARASNQLFNRIATTVRE